MFKKLPPSRVAQAMRSKARAKRHRRVADSKMDGLPDHELRRALEKKAFHRAVKEGEKLPVSRRIEQDERCHRIAITYKP